MIEQVKSTYFLLRKALEKQAKTIEGQGKEKEHGIQLGKSNAFSEKEESIPLDKQKKIFHNPKFQIN